ncbi:hypothetical protein [Actinoallomurus rhizosphaericola]|uniref:hypothetical protein n=1 Tax=Actinoallomurus rhizosphaericola TaxID=2952536 RepID=UPI0020933B80|nr:hypothetical protein [Actinoallomurus rhizosphaericola]MCO5998429.1 hypothetical protein [Actinoallomurus rhizosphaericola]
MSGDSQVISVFTALTWQGMALLRQILRAQAALVLEQARQATIRSALASLPPGADFIHHPGDGGGWEIRTAGTHRPCSGTGAEMVR